jgi:hypothetical protein
MWAHMGHSLWGTRKLLEPWGLGLILPVHRHLDHVFGWGTNLPFSDEDVHTYTKKIFDFTEIYPVGKMQPLSRSVKNYHSQLLQLRPSNQETLVIKSISYSYSLLNIYNAIPWMSLIYYPTSPPPPIKTLIIFSLISPIPWSPPHSSPCNWAIRETAPHQHPEGGQDHEDGAEQELIRTAGGV